jgi:peptide/nickel transport system permease protein
MTATTFPKPVAGPLEAEAMPEEISQFTIVWRRFLRHRLALFSSFVLMGIVLIALVAPVIAPYAPQEIDLTARVVTPGTVSPDGRVHWLGTDNLGRDIFSRVLYAARISLTVAVTAQLGSSLIGIVVGAISGYLGSWIDSVLMRFVEFMLTIPQLPLLLIVSSLLTRNENLIPIPEFLKQFMMWLLILQDTRQATQVILIIFVFVLFGWLTDSRLMRGQVLALKEQTFTEASRAIGASSMRIVFAHLVPNSMAPMIVNASLGLSGFIIGEAALSFLGLGIQDPTPTWGNMLSASQEFMRRELWMPIVTGLPIFICSLAFNFVGDGVRDALDPRLKL